MPIRPSTGASATRREHRIELRPLGELELLDDLAGEVAREHELDLAGHRLLVDGGAALERLLGSGRRKTFSRASISTRASDVYRG